MTETTEQKETPDATQVLMTKAEFDKNMEWITKASAAMNKAIVGMFGEKPQGMIGYHMAGALAGWKCFEYGVMNAASIQAARTQEAVLAQADRQLGLRVVDGGAAKETNHGEAQSTGDSAPSNS